MKMEMEMEMAMTMKMVDEIEIEIGYLEWQRREFKLRGSLKDRTIKDGLIGRN